MDKAKIGAFNPASGLELLQAKNGGWVVYERSAERHLMPSMLGAYSNANDMIEALSSALITTTSDGGV